MSITTTNSNPGVIKPYEKKTIKEFLHVLIKKLKKRNIKEIIFYIYVELINKYREIFVSNDYLCSICESRIPFFYATANENSYNLHAVCPICSSRARHRLLKYAYAELFADFDKEKYILHIAPEPMFYEFFNKVTNYYKTADLYLDDVDFPNTDLQNLKFSSNSIDVFLFNHVLEHIPNDQLALYEVYRTLKLNGFAVITVPGDFTKYRNKIYSPLTVNSHYREYGKEFINQLKFIFDQVELYQGKLPEDRARLGIKHHEYVFIAYRRA